MKYQQGTLLMGVLLALSQVCQAQIQCYVCDDCDKIKPDTPLERCDASFFEPTDMSTTMATTQVSTETSASSLPITDTTTSTTTTAPTTMTTTTSSTTTATVVTEESTMNTVATTNSTSTETTMDSTTVDSTTVSDNLPPTPSIVTTTPVPTPPTEGTVPSDGFVVPTDGFIVLNGNETVNSPPYMLANRRRRATADSNNYTYHCYRIAHLVNGTSVTKRGCTRVNTMQSACGVIREQDPTASKCYPCSMTRCNGSSALGASFTALFLAVVAAVLRRQ